MSIQPEQTTERTEKATRMPSHQQRDNGTTDDSRLLMCENCGNLLAGQWTNHERLIPIGTDECHICGREEFRQVSFPDLDPHHRSGT